MARLRYINYTPHRCLVEGRVQWAPHPTAAAIDGLPQIVWNDSSPWREANLWALQRATEHEVSIETVKANMTSLLMYATWLEDTKTEWWSFPVRKADRCLVQFRGYLIESRDQERLSPSTTTQRMRDVINFYRWLSATGLLSSEWPLWQERMIGIQLTNSIGFQRTLMVKTTDLAIKLRTTTKERLEDGLLPVSAGDRDLILEFAREHATWEMFLMLTLGFFTGMRLGTICDIKEKTVQNAIPEPNIPGLFKLSVGPAARPSVATKFGVSGSVWITQSHLELLKTYIDSPRRKARKDKASPEHKELVFLTRYGNSYARDQTGRSSALNVEMHSLRQLAKREQLNAFDDFHFHVTRCTFATQLAQLLIPISGAVNALAIIKEALLHKDEATSLKYIRFVERTPAMAEAANAFTRAFLGVASSMDNDKNE